MDDLSRFWPVSPPGSITRCAGGVNNETSLVVTPEGRFILRIYRPGASEARINQELTILRLLGDQSLSVSVPSVIPTNSGSEVARIPRAHGGMALATLTRAIAGSTPDWTPAVRPSAMAGEVLGELTGALNQISPQTEPGVSITYGDLHLISAAFPDPVQAPGQLPLPGADRQRLSELILAVSEQMPNWYSTLPHQVIHGDYVPGNLLMLDGRITAVLDFEQSGYDLRAIDLAVGLAAVGSGLWGSGEEWPDLEGFVRGYRRHQEIRPDEVSALPFLMRLRRVATFLHMAGRWKSGDGGDELLWHGVKGALTLEDWLARNSGRLVSCAADWVS